MTWFIVLIVIVFATEALARWRIRLVYVKYARCSDGVEETGAVIARRMLRANGLDEVAVHSDELSLSDRYSRDTRTVVLSEEVYCGRNATSVAVACHECGHACQHAEKMRLLKAGDALVPVTRVCATAWVFVVLLGIAVSAAPICLAGCAMLALAVVCALAVLPVELDASKRALVFLASREEDSALPEQTMRSIRKVLRAAAGSYLTESLMGVLDFIARAFNQLVRE